MLHDAVAEVECIPAGVDLAILSAVIYRSDRRCTARRDVEERWVIGHSADSAIQARVIEVPSNRTGVA